MNISRDADLRDAAAPQIAEPKAPPTAPGQGFTPWPDAMAARYRDAGYWHDETLPDAMRRWAQAHGARTALIDANGQLSFSALDARIDRLAAGLSGLGIGAGDTVLLQLPNSTSFVVAAFAIMRTGARPVFVLPAHRERDIIGISEVARPVAYIVADQFLGFDYRQMAATVQSRAPSLRHVIVDGAPGAFLSLEALETDPIRHALADPSGVALLLLSGGTTGTPKLIPRTHADYLYNATASAALCDVTQASVYLAALPAAHNFTLACPGILGTLSIGGSVVMATTPSPDECFELIATHGVTHTALVPALADTWLSHRAYDDGDLSSLQLLQVGGALLPEASAKRVEPELGARLQQVFGMAEGLICYTRPGDPDAAIQTTQGRPLCPDDEVIIADAEGRPVAEGEVGELWVRGPYTIRGYFRAPEHNLRSFSPDGFYKSGDLVRRDADGNLRVEGRIKEQINRAGEKISAAEIEAFLRNHPAIRDAVVIGVPDTVLGEKSRAVLIAKGDAPPVTALRAYLKEQGLAQFKIPDEFAFVTGWPFTAVGKVDKRRLADLTQPAPNDGRQPFLSDTIRIHSDPLQLAAHLAKTAEGPATVYERLGEWSVGLGSLARLDVASASITVMANGADAKKVLGDPLTQLEAALAELRLSGWRAYGIAKFELARHLLGLPGAEPDHTLLTLDLPRYDCRLTDGQAILRATSAEDLSHLRQVVRTADAALAGQPRAPIGQQADAPFRSLGANTYSAAVAAAVAEIRSGAYQKVIVSRRVAVEGQVDIAASYVNGRARNQPVRSFLRLSDGLAAAGFSPETVVEVDAEGHVSTQPLAGTRALGPDDTENRRLARELLSDTKEIAEHAVSVKTAYVELNEICDPRSVHVPEFMDVKPRGAVQHLASRVNGRLGDGRTRWDAFAALFPAVTASGCPKREAVDAIGRLEPGPRGLYSGCVFIADDDGFLDAALVLRSFFQADGETWLQAGAGIVDQSRPERELQETIEKMTGVAQSLVRPT